ncbi:alpha/beta hydrolase [Paenibacillus thermotolerans]|uniref:alpha/beta hydrolase n=1 Tax=Paenibacillus thermotolerans TaxID=3027807 RepID=UPI002368ECA1|nr:MULTISPECIES: alpha/beta fold hydrolase [unclassified Paenibacillus]
MERHIQFQFGKINIAATLHYPGGELLESGNPRLPVVVVCHGFAGNRIGQERLFVKAARELADQGYVVLRFDYAGCGESTGDYGASGLQHMIDQTRYVLDYALDLDFVDPTRVTLLGHSLGGAVALLTAARDKRVTSLVLWAPSAHPFQDIVQITGKEAYEEAITRGSSEYLGYTLHNAFFDSLSEFHPLKEATQFQGDVFLVHGTADTAIPADYSFLYQKVFWTRIQGQCDKEIVHQADHAFSTKGHAKHVIKATIDWLERAKNQKDAWFGWGI